MRLLSKLTYANVVATMAFAMATGGTAYAAVHLNGHSIKKHSVPANRLVRSAVVPRAALANKVEHLLISHGKVEKARGHHDVPIVTSNDAASGQGTMVSIAQGDSATIFQSGPFTLTAMCVKGSGGSTLEIDGRATEAWYTGDTGGGTSDLVKAGDNQPLYGVGNGGFNHPYAFTVLNNGVSMFGVDGQSLILGDWTGTYNIYADCTFSGTALSS